MNDAERFLRALHPSLDPGEYLELRGVRAGGSDDELPKAWCPNVQHAARTAAAWSKHRFHVYVSVNPRVGKVRGDLGVSRIRVVAADIDAKLWDGVLSNSKPPFESVLSIRAHVESPEETGGFESFEYLFCIPGMQRAFQAVSTFPIRPSMAVFSGGGLQPYWLFEQHECNDTATRERCRILSDRLAKSICGPDITPDRNGSVERVLRVPGSQNWKYQPAREVRLLWCEPERRYSMAQLEAWLDERAAWTKPIPAPPREITPRRETDGLIEDFNARYDLGELLVAHGAHELRPHGGKRYFAKAGQTSNSATLDYYPGWLILQAESFLGLSKQQKHGYSAFAVYTALEHGGDGKSAYAAAKALGYGPHLNHKGMRIVYTSGKDAQRRMSRGGLAWQS